MLEDKQLIVVNNKKNKYISVVIVVTIILSIAISIIPSLSNIAYATEISNSTEENSEENVKSDTNNNTTNVKTPIANTVKNSTSENNDKTKSSGSTNNVKSNNANLKSLGIRPNDFKGFSPNKTTYSVTVENNITSIEIYATAQNSKSKISGTGKKSLKEGNNVFNVTVTAEDKTNKTYKINVKRLSEGEGKKEDEENDNINSLSLSELKVNDIQLSPEFAPDVYEYTAVLTEKLDKLDITAISGDDNANIEIIGNENLAMGENVITILVKSSKSEEVSTYQLIINKQSPLANNSQEVSDDLEQGTRWSTKRKIAIVVLTSIICMAGIVFAIIEYMYTNRKE